MKSRWIAAACLSFIVTASTYAQTDARMVQSTWIDKIWGATSDKVIYQQQAHLADGSGNAQIFWWDSIGRFRLTDENSGAFTLGYRLLLTNLDTRSPALPNELNKMSVAAGMTLMQCAESNLKLVGGFGYSGDNLFSDANGIFGVAHLINEYDLGSGRSLILSLDYDGASALLPDTPLPGIQYVQRDKVLSYGVGFPRSFVMWQLTDALTFDAMYEVPYQADVYLDQKIAGHFSLFANFANFFEGFELNHHADTDRFFQQMRRAEIGVRYSNPDVYKGLSLDAAISVGYAFDQSFYSGWDVRELDKSAQISDEPYIALIIRGTF